MTKPVLLGFSGSLRRESANTAILRTLAEMVADKADLKIRSLADLPLYNGDEDGEHAPKAVKALKAAILAADGIVIASPEYNYGTSGVLKNAIDWASRPAYASVLKGKPVLVMTSSPGLLGGVRAQIQVREMMAATLSRVVSRAEIVIPGVYQKIVDGRLVDGGALEVLAAAMDDLLGEIRLLGHLKSA